MKKGRKNFSMKLFLFSLFLTLCVQTSFAQETRQISGTVMDTGGEPLIGVSVKVVNQQLGTVTDLDGKFTLNAKPNTTLEINYVGFEGQKINLGERISIDVVLKENTELLDEVVVIGYGVARKKDLTGATSSLKGTAIIEVPVTTAAQAITGKVAGVNVVTQSGAPGADINITVRGGTSITQSNAPLYIVDGFQMEDGLRSVDVNDIESIDVMKDASATAIYGARGSNGVILITTKSGKSGKTEVRYNGYLSFEKLGKKLNLLNAQQYAEYQYDLQVMGGKDSNWATIFGGDTNDSDFYTGAYSRIANDYASRGIDWQKEVFGGTAMMQNHNVSISGGTDKTRFMLSYNYTGQDGILDKSGYNKNSVRVKLNHEISKRIRFDFGANLQTTTIEGGGSLDGMLKMSILQPATGGARYTDKELVSTDVSEEMEKLNQGTNYDIANPIIENDAVTQQKYTRQATANFGLDVDIIDGLTFRTSGSYMWQQVRDDYFDDGRTKTAKTNGIWGKRNNEEKFTWQITNTLSWMKNFNLHKINVMLGQETSYQESMYLRNTYFDLPLNTMGLNNLDTTGKVDKFQSSKLRQGIVSVFGRVMYNYDDRYLLTATLRGDGTSKFARGEKWGILPSASAAWRISEESFMKEMNIFDNLKLRLGYGVTGNCNIDDNMYATDYGSTAVLVNKEIIGGLKPGSVVGNSTLRWEQTKSTNIGLDISVLRGRVSLTADFYNNQSENLLLKAKIPESTGYTHQYQNIGTIRNRGLEFVLNTVNINTKDFQWTTDFNISFNKSKVIKLSQEGSNSFFQNVDSRIDFLVEEGKSLGQFYGYKYAGVYTTDDFDQKTDGTYSLKDGVPYLKGKTKTSIKPGDVKYFGTADQTDANGNPIWSTEDRTVIGNSEPKFTGGITNTFTYKGFDLSLFFNFSYGNDVFNMSSQRFIGPYLPNQNSLDVMASRFRLVDPNTGLETTDLARLSGLNPNQHSKNAMWSAHADNKIAITDALDYYVEDGSFLRLNTITLGYTLPKRFTSKAYISNARIYTTLNNIHTFTDYTGYDPEVASSSSAITRGIDNSSYPRAKSFVIGVNLTF